MAGAGELSRRELFLKTQQDFRTNAFEIIEKMVDWCNKTRGSKHLVDEILHSIFFLGKINNVPFSPENIIPNKDMFIQLKEKYSRPFECYQTQLPRRSPFSCVLDMVVLQTSPENENQIKQTLRDLVGSLKPGFLVSSTICVSKSNKSSKQYGVSMSTTGPNAGRIVTAASCLSSYWDEYVAGAVMTYDIEKKKQNKKSYFDGTIKLPKDVTCKAYNISKGSEIDPCKSCGNLFDLSNLSNEEWPYGNCAEVESLSNLFEKEQEVKEQSKPTSDTCTPENREKARNYTLQELKKILNMIKFNTLNKDRVEFYRASI